MILLYQGRSLISRAIQAFTRSPYSHAAWLMEDGRVIEAWRGRVRCQPTIDHGHTPDTLIEVYDFTVPLAPKQRRSIEEWLLKRVGRRYDFWSVVGFVTRFPRRNDERWFCSELIFAAVRYIRPLLVKIQPWQVYPGLLSFSPLLVLQRVVRSGAR